MGYAYLIGFYTKLVTQKLKFHKKVRRTSIKVSISCWKYLTFWRCFSKIFLSTYWLDIFCLPQYPEFPGNLVISDDDFDKLVGTDINS